MKKTLLTATLIAALASATLSAEAFCWRNLNPANWGTCPPCEKTASCKCKKDKCIPPCKKEEKTTCCPTKNSCQTEKPKCNSCKETCNPCDKLQQETERP